MGDGSGIRNETDEFNKRNEKILMVNRLCGGEGNVWEKKTGGRISIL